MKGRGGGGGSFRLKWEVPLLAQAELSSPGVWEGGDPKHSITLPGALSSTQARTHAHNPHLRPTPAGR